MQTAWIIHSSRFVGRLVGRHLFWMSHPPPTPTPTTSPMTTAAATAATVQITYEHERALGRKFFNENENTLNFSCLRMDFLLLMRMISSIILNILCTIRNTYFFGSVCRCSCWNRSKQSENKTNDEKFTGDMNILWLYNNPYFAFSMSSIRGKRKPNVNRIHTDVVIFV